MKLWRVLTGKKMLAYIREKWTAEQLVHMTAHARGEEGMAHMRVNTGLAPTATPRVINGVITAQGARRYNVAHNANA